MIYEAWWNVTRHGWLFSLVMDKAKRNKQDEDKAVKESEMSVRWSIRLKLEEEDTFERQELPVL